MDPTQDPARPQRPKTEQPGPEQPEPEQPMPAALREARPLPEVVQVPARVVVALDGHGGSEAAPFQEAIAALSAVALAIGEERRRLGAAGAFQPAPLEARLWTDDGVRSIAEAPPEAWRWRLRAAVPADVVDEDVAAAVAQVAARRPELATAAARVRRERVGARRCGRILQVGPRAAARAGLEEIREAVEAAHLSDGQSHLEIYLSDPRTTPPADLRTVLLVELAR